MPRLAAVAASASAAEAPTGEQVQIEDDSDDEMDYEYDFTIPEGGVDLEARGALLYMFLYLFGADCFHSQIGF